MDGHELKLPSWQEWSARDPLLLRAVDQMVPGVSTRCYARSLEPLPQAIAARGISKSAVSERFVYGTESKLAELMSRELRALPLVALLIDGVHFAEHVMLAAVGVDDRGTKHVLTMKLPLNFKQHGASQPLGGCHLVADALANRRWT